MYDYQPPKVEYVQYVTMNQEVKESVREAYGRVAEADSQNKCCGNGRSCCGVSAKPDLDYSQELGYSREELESVPDGANMGLGCGNPSAIAALVPGERVLDLGAGGGFDAFLAAHRVGPTGRVFGVDMTAEMVAKARLNAEKGGYHNVDFLLGEIEHLPLPDGSVDVIISNCVINLSTDKGQVFREAHRVLARGGRLAISDIVADRPLPPEMVANSELYCNCISGALPIAELTRMLREAGFHEISIEPQEGSRMFIKDWVAGANAESYVVSAKITACKR